MSKHIIHVVSGVIMRYGANYTLPTQVLSVWF